jgi:predicted ribosome quality control (RQC) complex YloA/Tae2 family protein
MKIIEHKYILGENAQDNWNILEKIEPNHYFFHLTSFPSPYVILFCDNQPTIEEITLAAQLCKKNTKYRNLKNLRVDYCPCSNITKGKNIGEVIFRSLRKVKNIKI